MMTCPDRREVSAKPAQDRTAAHSTVTLGEVRLVSTPDTTPPIQKKHMVRVKFMAS